MEEGSDMEKQSRPGAYRCGDKVPVSGQYSVVRVSTGKVLEERTCTKGEPFPPYPKYSVRFVLADATKHFKPRRRGRVH